jgi:hypothetical protein
MSVFEGSPYGIFEKIERGITDEVEMVVLKNRMQRNLDPKNDREFIKKAKAISLFDDRAVVIDHWAYHSKEISEGAYPLELLPEHIRDLAKNLYYK